MSDRPSSLSSPLSDAACELAAQYHAQPQLVADQRGWSRAISLCANDSADAVRLEITDGWVSAITPAAELEPSAAPAHVVIRGPQALLQRILHLRQPPSEPYLFGELTVEGPEPDFLRLDYIVTSLALRPPGPAEDPP